MQRIRPALEQLDAQIGLSHALASQRLYTDGAEVRLRRIAVLSKLTAACTAPGPFQYVASRSGLRRVDLGQDS